MTTFDNFDINKWYKNQSFKMIEIVLPDTNVQIIKTGKLSVPGGFFYFSEQAIPENICSKLLSTSAENGCFFIGKGFSWV